MLFVRGDGVILVSTLRVYILRTKNVELDAGTLCE